jgi:hypothetical protein
VGHPETADARDDGIGALCRSLTIARLSGSRADAWPSSKDANAETGEEGDARNPHRAERQWRKWVTGEAATTRRAAFREPRTGRTLLLSARLVAKYGPYPLRTTPLLHESPQRGAPPVGELEAEGIGPGIHRERAAVEPVRDDLAIGRHLHVEEVTPIGVARGENDARDDALDPLEPCPAVDLNDRRTTPTSASSEFLSRLYERVCVAQHLAAGGCRETRRLFVGARDPASKRAGGNDDESKPVLHGTDVECDFDATYGRVAT